MENLKWLREQGELMSYETDAMLAKLSIRDGVRDFIVLYRTLKPQFDQTEFLFRKERENYLATLQRRLKQHGNWEKKRARPLHKRRKTTKASC